MTAVAHPLIEAFHAIFDAKDAAGPGTQTFYAAYEAIQKLEIVMAEAGIPVPRRFDGEGRKGAGTVLLSDQQAAQAFVALRSTDAFLSDVGDALRPGYQRHNTMGVF